MASIGRWRIWFGRRGRRYGRVGWGLMGISIGMEGGEDVHAIVDRVVRGDDVACRVEKADHSRMTI